MPDRGWGGNQDRRGGYDRRDDRRDDKSRRTYASGDWYGNSKRSAGMDVSSYSPPRADMTDEERLDEKVRSCGLVI